MSNLSEEEKQAIEYLKRNDIVEIECDNYGLEHIHRIGIDEKQILLNYIDKLQKENKKYIDVFNATEKIMNGQERTKDKLLKENVELQKDNYKLDRESQHYFDRIQDLQKELENLKEVDRQICCEELITKDKYQDILKENAELKEQRDNAIQLRNEIIEDQKITCISKNIIRKKIKEVEKEYQDYIKNVPKEQQAENDIFLYKRIIEVLKELLGE